MKWTDTGGGDFETPEAGTYSAVCYRVVDIGTQTSSWEGKEIVNRQVFIAWEIEEKMSDSRPFVVGQFYTASLSEKANLRKIMTSWRGRDFTEEELAGFDPKNILGAPCMLTLSLTDKQKIKVSAVSKLPKSMIAMKPENEILYLSLEPGLIDEDVIAKLGKGIQAKIHQSPEWINRNASIEHNNSEYHDPMDDVVEDLPF